jgi:hypothetical protein
VQSDRDSYHQVRGIGGGTHLLCSRMRLNSPPFAEREIAIYSDQELTGLTDLFAATRSSNAQCALRTIHKSATIRLRMRNCPSESRDSVTRQWAQQTLLVGQERASLNRRGAFLSKRGLWRRLSIDSRQCRAAETVDGVGFSRGDWTYHGLPRSVDPPRYRSTRRVYYPPLSR